jgi:hypothetical protein
MKGDGDLVSVPFSAEEVGLALLKTYPERFKGLPDAKAERLDHHPGGITVMILRPK